MSQATSVPGAVEDLFTKADRSGAGLAIFDQGDRATFVNKTNCELYPFVDFSQKPTYEDIFWGCVTNGYFVDEYYYERPSYWIEYNKWFRTKNQFAQFIRKYKNGAIFSVFHERIGGFGSYLARIDITSQFTDLQSLPLIGPSLWTPTFRPQDPWSSSGVLERIQLPACVIDVHGVLLDANRAMVSLLEARDGLQLHHGRLVASNRLETQEIHGHARRCADLKNVSFTARVSRLSSPHPYAARVSSEIPEEWWRGRQRLAAALVLAITPETAPRLPGVELEKLYSLTPSEGRVATAIAGGKTVREVAKENGTSVGTVRNQLKAIYSKMGVSRQSDLVIVISNIARLVGR